MKLFGDTVFKLKNEPAFLGECRGLPLREKYRDGILKAARAALDGYELTQLKASDYMHYFKTGNRSFFESMYHARRARLAEMLMGALYGGVSDYVGKMVDIMWAICEETTWVIPPHSVTKPYVLAGRPLPDMFGDDIVEVDLFSAATGALLSMVYHYFKNELSSATDGVLGERLKYEINRRIIKPFMTYEMRWTYSFINNWAPWIVSNVLTCAAVFADDALPTRQTVVLRAVTYLERFVSTYGDDGGCNEGVGYWNAAIGTLFDACEELYDISGGQIDYAGAEFIRRACRFAADMCVCPEKRLFVNFADCGPYVRSISGEQVRRMGHKTGDGALLAFGRAMCSDMTSQISGQSAYFFIYRAIKNLYEMKYEGDDKPFIQNAVYADLGVAVLREGDFVAVLKGGHNRESHNHNDVGHFVFYSGGDPVIIDPGNLEYTRDTFNENRYKIWTNQSSYHNLPDIGGVMQKDGREYEADGFSCDKNTAAVSYGKAYPVPAECRREITLDKGGLTVIDTVKAAGDVTFHFMVKAEPRVTKNTVAIGDMQMTFSENGGISVDEVDVSSSPAMTNTWGQTKLYRINVRASALKTRIEKRG